VFFWYNLKRENLSRRVYVYFNRDFLISILYELKNELNSKDEKELQDQNEDFLRFKLNKLFKLYEKGEREFSLPEFKKLSYESDGRKYNDFYVTYLDYSSYNNEILENYKSHMDLVKYKKTLDKFFYKLKNDMEENNTLNDEEIAKYKKKYKNIVDFLQTVYFAEKGGKKINEDNSNITFEFSSELSLDDAYTVLSIISLIYSTIINPIYNNYKDMYIQFANRKRFINQYNKRLLQITYQALNLSYKDKLDYNDNDDLEEFVD